MKKLLLSSLLCLASVSSFAVIEPMPIAGDNRVQQIIYANNEVFNIHAGVGNSTLIQLEDGEEVEGDNTGLGMGDAQAWSLAVRGNNIFLKPAQALPDTNMILVTNRRTYAFQLTTANPMNPSYIVRFVYPDTKKDNAKPVAPQTPARLRQVLTTSNGEGVYINADTNTQYYKQGSNEIAPTNAWDNGQFTYLKFANASDLPAVYRLLPDKKTEAVVDTHIEGDTLVIHGVSRLYRLRLGNSSLDIFNANPKFVTSFNVTGVSKVTGKDGAVREILGGNND